MTLKILHITGRSDHGGGPEHVLQILQARDNESSSFVACPANGVYWKRYSECLGVERLCAIPHRRVSVLALARLVLFARRHGVEVIHSHGMSGGIYGRLVSLFTRVPCVHTFHGLPRTLTVKHTLYWHTERLLSRWTRLGIAVSPSEERLIRHRYPMYAGRLAIVENGIEEGAEAAHVAARGDLPAQLKTIISFTRLNQQKNPWLVIAIAEELRRRGELDGVRFRLYGEGVSGRSFRRQVLDAGLSRHIRVFPPVDDPTTVLEGAFAYLSTSRWEGMPLSLLEAHREGICVIASRVIGNRDVVAHGRNGMLFPEGDAAAAAAQIIALKHDPALRAALRLAGASGCRERHNRDLMVGRLQQIYHLLARSEPAAPRPEEEPEAIAATMAEVAARAAYHPARGESGRIALTE